MFNFDFDGKCAFIRVDFNVPMDGNVINDDTRIRAAIPTIKHVLESGGAVICASHLGRPKGKRVTSLSMAPIGKHLQDILGDKFAVLSVDSVCGPTALAAAEALEAGEVLLLENLRFEAGETKNDAILAKKLASMADVFIQEAFGTCHRHHASTVGVPSLLKPALPGKLLGKEINAFQRIFKEPNGKLLAIIGGAKVSDKIIVLENLIEKVDAIIIGGGMAYTFLRAQGKEIGDSLFESEYLSVAKKIINKAVKANVEIHLPVDHKVAKEFDNNSNAKVITGSIPEKYMGLDIGPETIKKYQDLIAKADTVVWNGPMGVFEFDNFSHGTSAIAQTLANSECVSIVGGGDSVAAIKKNKVEKNISHISTGGGAFLEMLEGKDLPGIAILDQNKL